MVMHIRCGGPAASPHFFAAGIPPPPSASLASNLSPATAESTSSFTPLSCSWLPDYLPLPTGKLASSPSLPKVAATNSPRGAGGVLGSRDIADTNFQQTPVGTVGTVQRFIGSKARGEQIDAEGVVRRGLSWNSWLLSTIHKKVQDKSWAGLLLPPPQSLPCNLI